jgi:hypothetical protein
MARKGDPGFSPGTEFEPFGRAVRNDFIFSFKGKIVLTNPVQEIFQ